MPKFLGWETLTGGFFPKVDEKYGDGDRKYNWWGCSKDAHGPYFVLLINIYYHHF